MMHTTQTAIAIDTAIRTAGGDFYATRRTTARFTTEALVDAAEQSLAGLTTSEIAKFATTVTYRKPLNPGREWALDALCSYMHAIKIREWGIAFEAARRAAQLELPLALEQLGAYV